jgi:hypothetical protein
MLRIRWGCGAVLLMLLASAVANADEIIERVMAVVSGDLILMSDVRAARALALVDAGDAPDADREVLARLIDRSLILAEVVRYAPPEPTAAAVDRQLEAVRARFGSAEALDASLARFGLDENHLRETLREDLRIRAYMDQRFAADDPARRQAAIDEWVAGLRRRADIVESSAATGR